MPPAMPRSGSGRAAQTHRCVACLTACAMERFDMNLQLDGTLVLVSGSTAGIGYAIVHTLSKEGARVLVNGRTQAAVNEAVDRIRKETGGAAEGAPGDLSDAGVAQDLVRRHAGIAVLVNNLGIFEPKLFEEIPDEDLRRFFDVNVLIGVRLSRLVLPAVRRAKCGRIVFIASESALRFAPRWSTTAYQDRADRDGARHRRMAAIEASDGAQTTFLNGAVPLSPDQRFRLASSEDAEQVARSQFIDRLPAS